MMNFKIKTVANSLHNSRCFSVWQRVNQKNHYETLGVVKSASQADIKSAFYKLSKKHHPDANVNDPTSTSRFQEIVEAYEVLGNEDARLRYDKGMRPQGSIATATSNRGFKTADDPKAAFYKSRLMNRMNSPTTGRTYNFDEWAKEHYSQNVVSNRHMKATATERTISKEASKSRINARKKEDQIISRFAIFLAGFILIAVGLLEYPTTHDKPKSKSK